MSKDWFSAHKDGLYQIASRLVERRGFGIIGAELYQNVMDTTATECKIQIDFSYPNMLIEVEDNGPGYSDLTHAWTVYAPSEKKADPTKAGRFNVGCKVALAFCKKAEIYTTSGLVSFDETGRREFPRRKRPNGTKFTALINKCSKTNYEEFLAYMNKLIIRPGLTVWLNGDVLPSKTPIRTFNMALQTEIGEHLRKSVRKTDVEVYDVAEGETAMLYELGIPVVETGDRWHYNVLQKVPLNVDRDNVTPAYIQSLRTAVYNEMHQEITLDDTETLWVQSATSDAECSSEAMKTFMDKKYGEKRVSFDPTNLDANAAALTKGYTIIPSRGMTTGQRDNAKTSGLLFSSSAAFPNVGRGAYSDDPNATPVEVVPKDEWSEGMELITDYAKAIFLQLTGEKLNVRFVNCRSFVGDRWVACFGHNSLDFNLFLLGKKYFEQGITLSLNSLLIHEFAHKYCSNHASDKFHDACCDLGAKLTAFALERPDFFKSYNRKFEKIKC